MTHRRFLIIFLIFLLTANTFIDRICISTASDQIMLDLNISQQMMGYIFAMFALSYSLFQIPSGWLADKYGPKNVLTPQEVKDEVKKRIDDLAPGGGFVFATVHNIQEDVPVENVIALWEALQEYVIY